MLCPWYPQLVTGTENCTSPSRGTTDDIPSTADTNSQRLHASASFAAAVMMEQGSPLTRKPVPLPQAGSSSKPGTHMSWTESYTGPSSSTNGINTTELPSGWSRPTM